MNLKYFIFIATCFVIETSCSRLYSENDVLSYGEIKEVIQSDMPEKILPVWIFKSTDPTAAVSDSVYSPLRVAILEETENHYLIANDSIRVKGYCLKGYIELDCLVNPNLCGKD